MGESEDELFLKELELFSPEGEPDTSMGDVEFDTQPGYLEYGEDHIQYHEGGPRPTMNEIKDVLFEMPICKRKPSKDDGIKGSRYIYWGTDRVGSEISVIIEEVCLEGGKKWWGLITAFYENEREFKRR